MVLFSQSANRAPRASALRTLEPPNGANSTVSRSSPLMRTSAANDALVDREPRFLTVKVRRRAGPTATDPTQRSATRAGTEGFLTATGQGSPPAPGLAPAPSWAATAPLAIRQQSPTSTPLMCPIVHPPWQGWAPALGDVALFPLQHSGPGTHPTGSSPGSRLCPPLLRPSVTRSAAFAAGPALPRWPSPPSPWPSGPIPRSGAW